MSKGKKIVEKFTEETGVNINKSEVLVKMIDNAIKRETQLPRMGDGRPNYDYVCPYCNNAVGWCDSSLACPGAY